MTDVPIHADDLDALNARLAADADEPPHTRNGYAGPTSRRAVPEQLDDLVRSARRIDRLAAGGGAPGTPEFDAAVADIAAQAERLRLAHCAPVPAFEFVGADALLATPLPEIDWLVGDGVLCRGGITLLTAAAKRGKSLAGLGLACDLVRAIVLPDCERTWLGSPVVGGGPALLLSAEGGKRMVRHRLGIIEPHLGEPLGRLRVLAERPFPLLSDPAQCGAIYDFAKREGAVLVVVDPLSRFWSIEDENAAGTMTAFFANLRAETERANAATLLIHHDAKTQREGTGPTFGGRGSSVLANEPDMLIDLTPHAADDPRASRAYFRGRWGEPEPRIVRVDPETLAVEFVGPLGKSSSTRRPAANATPLSRFAEALADGEWHTLDDVAKRAGVSVKTVTTWLAGPNCDAAVESRQRKEIATSERPATGAWNARFVRWKRGVTS